MKFLSRGSGYGLFLTANEAVLTLRKTVSGTTRAGLQRKLRPMQESAPSEVVLMRLAGAGGGAAAPVGEEPLPGTANYFIGNDSARWRAGVPTYAQVRYAGIYPGIDLVYYGNQWQLEYDFVAAPGADPKLIRLRFAGAKELHRTASGDLVLTVENGALVFRKPLVYQIVDGQRQTVAGDFSLLAKHTVGFRLGRYDRAKALVIDPVLVYSTYLGGSGGDSAYTITVDAAGDAYVAGRTAPTGFPVTPGAFQTTGNSAANAPYTAFVTKLNPAGTALVYSTYLGGSGGDGATGVAVDSSGNAYVTGSTSSTDFPVTQGAFQTTNNAAANGDATAFVAKLNPTGTALVYSTYLGGSGGVDLYGAPFGDQGTGLAVDNSGNAYVTGKTVSTDFPVTQGAFQITSPGQAAFVTKLNPTGTALVYSTYLGAMGDESGWGNTVALALDGSGNVYIAGATSSANFPVTPGAYQTTNHAAANKFNNVFVTKLNPSGSALVFSTYLGGSGGGCCSGDMASGVAVDGSGDVYVTGTAQSTDFPVTTGVFQTRNHNTNNSGSNAFVTKLNPTGTALVYSTYLGGSGGIINLSPTLAMLGGDQATGLAIDSSGDAYITGSTASANFPVTQGAYQTTNNDQGPCPGGCIGGYNAFVTELNPAGSALVYSTYLGGNGINPASFIGVIVFGDGDQASALALDSSGNVYLAGTATSADFPVTGGAFQTAIASGTSAFVSKLDIGSTSTATTPTVMVTPASATITSAKLLTVTVSVSGGSSSPAPTGTVTLASGTYSSAATTLSGGSATIDIPAGSLAATTPEYPSPDVLTVNYIPDAASSSIYKFASGVGSVYVIAPYIAVTPSTTTLTWQQSQSQALSVALAATGGSGNPTPTGTVTLITGSLSSAVTTLSAGNATISIPAGTLTTGFNTLYVNYSGDSNYAPLAPAGSALVTVGGVTVTVVPSSTSITTSQPLSVAITVSAGSGSPTPTGMVTLLSTNYTSPTVSLSNGSATITIPAGSLPVGIAPLNVSYGNGNYGGASGYSSVTVTGTAGIPSFTITGTAVSVAPRATTGNTSTITVTPTGGFTGTVSLSCAFTTNAATDPATCSIPASVTISGTTAQTATLTVNTTAATAGSCTAANVSDKGVPWYTASSTVLACMLLFGNPARRRRWLARLGMLALLITLTGGVLACGGSGGGGGCNAVGNPGTTAGNYTITVTGTSGAITQTGTVSLTVQ
ncbi:MAG: SBBP repeat-containing protein [Terracidiphilus sp.]